ncbi:unnamed protein product [Effrenium voratum]|nr:unnamed protein product [Effrenium voratum]
MRRVLILLALSAVLGEEFLSKKISARCLQRGWADDSQCSQLLSIAQDCFSWNPIDKTDDASLQASLGDATECVLFNLKQKWDWSPELSSAGSNTGDQQDQDGQSDTIISVDTPTGKWRFTLREAAAPSKAKALRWGHGGVMAYSLRRGDATAAQEADLLHFTEHCFARLNMGTCNLDTLQGSLGTAVNCVLDTCRREWHWVPQLSSLGCNTGYSLDGYGLGATIIGADVKSGKWLYVLRLKY